MTLHQRRVLRDGEQYCAKRNAGRQAGTCKRETRDYIGSGQYSAVKKIIVARLPGQCIRDEGLHVQDSILLGRQGYQDSSGTRGFRTVFCCEKNHCGKATRTLQQGRGFTGSGQYSAVGKKKSLRQGYQDSASGTRGYTFRTVFCCEKNHCGKATRTVHQGRGFTGSGQYSAVGKKNHCGKATRTVHQGREVTRSGQYSAVKKIIVARLLGHCSRDEGLQVQDSILLWEKKSLRQGYQDSASGTRGYRFRTVFCCEKNHCGKATRLHQGRGFTGSGQYSAVKKIIAARLPGQCIRDERLHVQDSILL